MRRLPACLLFSIFSLAQPLSIHLDPAQTKISFTLGSTLHTVHGGFRLKSGELQFEPDTRRVSGRLLIEAASGTTGNSTRDSRMQRNVLESDSYPEIVFEPARLFGKPAKLEGSLSIYGSRHPVAIPLQVTLTPQRTVLATGTFVVPYVAWGMKDPSNLLLHVDREVTVEITSGGTFTAGPVH